MNVRHITVDGWYRILFAKCYRYECVDLTQYTNFVFSGILGKDQKVLNRLLLSFVFVSFSFCFSHFNQTFIRPSYSLQEGMGIPFNFIALDFLLASLQIFVILSLKISPGNIPSNLHSFQCEINCLQFTKMFAAVYD